MPTPNFLSGALQEGGTAWSAQKSAEDSSFIRFEIPTQHKFHFTTIATKQQNKNIKLSLITLEKMYTQRKLDEFAGNL